MKKLKSGVPVEQAVRAAMANTPTWQNDLLVVLHENLGRLDDGHLLAIQQMIYAAQRRREATNRTSVSKR